MNKDRNELHTHDNMFPPEEDDYDYTPAIDFADSAMLIVICLLVYLAVFM